MVLKFSLSFAAAIVLVGETSCAAVAEQREVLVDFGTPEAEKSSLLNAWGGKKSASRSFDTTEGALHLVWTESDATFSSKLIPPAVEKAISSDRGVPARWYFRYRSPKLDSDTRCVFITTENFINWIGLRRDGEWHDAQVMAGGWNRNNTPFDVKELTDVQWRLSGSGDVYLKEFGCIYRDEPGKGKIDTTEVDTETVTLFPKPKVFKIGEGVLALGRYPVLWGAGEGVDHAVRFFATEMGAFYGRDFRKERGVDCSVLFALASTQEGRAAVEAHGLAKALGRIRHDGYVASASEKGIVVVANEPMGVYNGVRSLVTLIKQWSGDCGPAILKPFKLADWPRLGNRLLHQVPSCYGHANYYEPSYYADKLERFALDARFNLFSFELGRSFDYATIPELGRRSNAWTKDDLRAVIARLNACGATAVPFCQSPGHLKSWFFRESHIHRELRERGGDFVICTRHPKAYPTLFACFDELIADCSQNPRRRPKLVYAGGDEVDWGRGVAKNAPPCPYCGDTPKGELYVEHMKKVNGYLKAKGMKMMICSDMLTDTHNGLDVWRCAEHREKLPTDITILHWSDIDYDSMEYFAKRGHENWKLNTGLRDDPNGEEFVKGYGLALYNYNWWLTQTRARGSLQTEYGPMAMRITGSFAWDEPPAYVGCAVDLARKWGNFLMRNWSRKPVPAGTGEFRPVPLGSQTASVPGNFRSGDLKLSGVPLRVASAPSGLAALEAGAQARQIAFSGRAASFCFLHGGLLPVEKEEAFFDGKNYRDWTEGPVVARIRVTYADGSEETVEMKYGWNVNEIRPMKGERGAVFGRFLPDSRYALVAGGGEILNLYEWVNPHPEKEIAGLTLTTGGTDVRYLLVSLSARVCRH